jgi:hypothetical protein
VKSDLSRSTQRVLAAILRNTSPEFAPQSRLTPGFSAEGKVRVPFGINVSYFKHIHNLYHTQHFS